MKEKGKKTYKEAAGKIPEDMGSLEALSLAIYNEQSAYDLYNKISLIIQDPSGKEKFKFLASDEKRHRKILEDWYTKETQGKKFLFDPSCVKKIELEIKDQTTATEALDIAIQAEKSAYEFYKSAAQKTKDQDGKKMFESLASEEDGHYQKLFAEREALTGNFYWFSLDIPGIMEH